MISFIVIGRNEGWKLTKCLNSIYNTIRENHLNKAEVIYVDSDSSDDSLDRAKKFDSLQVYKLNTFYNAAIARNLGAEKSIGEILFFIDGDMEIVPDFLHLVYNSKDGLKYPFVSGQLWNFNFDKNDKFLNNTYQYRYVLKGDKYYPSTGGIFIIERRLWNLVGGMDKRFRRGQDFDFSLTLAKNGYKILRKKEIIANHYTTNYLHVDRLWKSLINGDIFYSRSLLYRKHFFNPQIFSRIIKTEYSLIILILLLIAAIVLKQYFILLLYLIVLIKRMMNSRIKAISELLQLVIYFPIRDLMILFGFFLFLPPKTPKNVTYEKIS